ncbi:hypothetical protein [Gluconobacter sp. Gdi]|uniref:hypothetical protein n=1 Tax=Gluconobacter sp. Gdi TaxID=2691888 RepID=UPI0017762A0C|nr:hypothetical protein [Gluconobacter sp. Gdi]GFE98108.1 hypothetical protein DmGdi_31810 [Gluconobacter sp. Gdi]
MSPTSTQKTRLQNALDEAKACPITPLGMGDGLYLIRDAAGDERTLLPRQIDNRHIVMSLFLGDDTWLRQNFPKYAHVYAKNPDGSVIAESRIVDFNREQASDWIANACFNAANAAFAGGE